MNTVINIKQKLSLFDELWTPKIIDEFNGQQLKLAKIKGEFVWHDHTDEDELFLVIEGSLKIEFRDRTVTINKGEVFVVPKGIEHKPFAEEECHVILLEPKNTKHTGTVEHDLTVNKQEKI